MDISEGPNSEGKQVNDIQQSSLDKYHKNDFQKFVNTFIRLILPNKINLQPLKDWLEHVPKTFIAILVVSLTIIATAVLIYLRSEPGKEFVKRTSSDISGTTHEIKWTSYEESLSEGVVKEASQILEVDLKYDENGQEKISLLGLKIKKGHAPPDLLSEKEYRLVLGNESGTILEYFFDIPRLLSAAPPLDGSVVGEEISKPVSYDFTVTTPWVNGADTVQILDTLGNIVISASTEDVERVENKPEFKTLDGADIKRQLNKSSLMDSILDVLSSPTNAQVGDYVDLVFIGDNYTSSADLEDFHSDINRMLNHLITYEPFSTRISQFAFHYVDNLEDLGCYYSGRFLFCNQSKIKNIINTAGVPYEDIMVIVNSDTYGGTAWEDIAHTYNGDPYSEEVFVHEYGHSLARLEDEYISNQPYNRRNRNCYVGYPPNPDWGEYVEDNSYFLGCNTYEWYRSSSDSIMRSVRATYFNEISKFWINYTIDQYAGEFVVETPTPTPTPTLKPGETPVPTATHTPTPTLAPGETPVPTATHTPTPTLAPNETPIPTPTNTSIPTPTATNIPTPTPTTGSCNSAPVFYFRDRDPYPSNEFHIWAGTGIWYESITVTIFNPNSATCLAWNPPLSFSWAVPLDWTLEPAYNSISLKGQKSGEWPATLRVPQNALPGTYNIQFWLASYGPLNGTVEVHPGVCQFWNPPYNYCTSP